VESFDLPFIVYLDETGDHSLKTIDPGFPIFVLVMLICDTRYYAEQIVPKVYNLKIDYFGHEAFPLHSIDIRKGQKNFVFLSDAAKRQPFYERINEIMSLDYTLIAGVIRKEKHVQRYGPAASNPYGLAMEFTMERLLPLLESKNQTDVYLIAEARGKKEDAELLTSFNNVITRGTSYVAASRFAKIQFHLLMERKSSNVIGTQLADLVAYPIARHVLSPGSPNPAFDVFREKFYDGPGKINGLKIFP
jgi:hypothetical protein